MKITDAKLSKYNYICCINLLWYKQKENTYRTCFCKLRFYLQCLHLFPNLSFLWNPLQHKASLLVHFLAQLSSHSFSLIGIPYWLQMYKKYLEIGKYFNFLHHFYTRLSIQGFSLQYISQCAGQSTLSEPDHGNSCALMDSVP